MKQYNSIKAEEKIMSDNLTKKEKEFADSFKLGEVNRMKYIYTGTKEQLDNNYFDVEEGSEWIRGDGMGWAHKVDKETGEISWVDEEHAKDRNYYAKVGGLEAFIKDLIKMGLVEIRQ